MNATLSIPRVWYWSIRLGGRGQWVHTLEVSLTIVRQLRRMGYWAIFADHRPSWKPPCHLPPITYREGR